MIVVTVFTDASHCPNTRAAGGAYWARDSTNRASASFGLAHAKKAHEAEIQAACTGILAITSEAPLNKTFRDNQGDLLLVLVVDCLAVKNLFEGIEVTMGPPTRDLYVAVLERLLKLNIKLKVNHVKGHSGMGTPRQWANDWCDREAYKRMSVMRKRRHKLQKMKLGSLAELLGE